MTKLKGLLAAALGITAVTGFAAGTSYPAPYAQVNVGVQYLKDGIIADKDNPFYTLSSYLIPPKSGQGTLTITSANGAESDIGYYFAPSNPYEHLLIKQNFLQSNFDKLSNSKQCQVIPGKPNEIKCDLGVKLDETGATLDLPIVINDGIYPRPLEQFVKAAQSASTSFTTLTGAVLQKVQYMQVSAKPSDFSGSSPVAIVPLRDYFGNPTGQAVSYHFDATPFCQGYTGSEATACTQPVAMLRAIGQTPYYLTQVTPTSAHQAVHSLSNVPVKVQTHAAELKDGTRLSYFQTRLSCSSAQGYEPSCGVQLNWDGSQFNAGQELTVEFKDANGDVVPGTSYTVDATNGQSTNTIKLGDGSQTQFSLFVGVDGSQLQDVDDLDLSGSSATGFTDEAILKSPLPAGCSAAPTFYIGIKSDNKPGGLFANSQGPYLYGENLCPGIYQINIRASSASQNAYTTFYVNVSDDNSLSLSQWQDGGVGSQLGPSTNLFNTSYGDVSANDKGPLIPTYIYSKFDSTHESDFQADVEQYTADLKYVKDNGDVPSSSQVSALVGGSFNFKFPGTTQRWVPASGATVLDQIQYDGVTSDRVEQNSDNPISSWLNTEANTWKGGGVKLVLDSAFSNPLKANFATFNPAQLQILAQHFARAALWNDNITGMTMDLEGGITQPQAVYLYKLATDRLAYRAKWFGFYEFGDVFVPSMVDAFGPTGVALISGYDVGQYRAPQAPNPPSVTTANNEFLTWGYTGDYLSSTATGQKWASADASDLYGAFALDTQNANGCNTLAGSSIPLSELVSPVSWCNLTPNDSASENYRRWLSCPQSTPTGKDDTVKWNNVQAMQYLNGQYSVILPLSWSATEWTHIEAWKPDFAANNASRLRTKGRLGNRYAKNLTLVLDPTACKTLTNDWFKQNGDQLDTVGSAAYNQLMACINPGVNLSTSKPIQVFSRCGKTLVNNAGSPVEIPYSSCILVSALPGNFKTTPVQAPFDTNGSTGLPNAFADNSGSNPALSQSNQVQYLLANTLDNIYNHKDKHLIGYGVYSVENHLTSPYAAYSTEKDSGSLAGAWGDIPENTIVQEPLYIGGSALRAPLSEEACLQTLDVSSQSLENVHQDPFYCTAENNTLIKDTWQQLGYLETALLNSQSDRQNSNPNLTTRPINCN